MRIDLNSDVGESYGAWSIGHDEELIPLVTSVNVACGAHAGDPLVMARTVELAGSHGAAIGAHPGYPDRDGFGRRELDMSDDELAASRSDARMGRTIRASPSSVTVSRVRRARGERRIT